MENLEETCLEKINKILEKHEIKIIQRTTETRFQLIDLQQRDKKHPLIDSLLCTWENTYDMFFNKSVNKRIILPLFDFFQTYYKMIHNGGFKLLVIPKQYIDLYTRYSLIYDDIKILETCESLEELIIKIDLLGI
jgi:hypothetical protein